MRWKIVSSGPTGKKIGSDNRNALYIILYIIICDNGEGAGLYVKMI